MRRTNNNFLLYKRLFGRINHHQLSSKYVLHNCFAFYQTWLVKSKKLHYKLLRKKMHFFVGSLYCQQLLSVTPFRNNTSLSKSFSSLRSGIHRAINDVSNFLPALAFFGAFGMTAQVKQWSVLFWRCFDGSEHLVGLFMFIPSNFFIMLDSTNQTFEIVF